MKPVVGAQRAVREENTLVRRVNASRRRIRQDGREIFITSDREGGQGQIDIWVATRDDNSQLWSTPTNPGAPLNSTADDGSPALSKDGETLYFFSNRDDGFGGRDIYFTRRTAFERRQIEDRRGKSRG